jgi:ATP-binding cassette subfamily F protein 3
VAEIVLKDIHKYYGIQHVLRGISFEVFEGTRTALLGKNGSGKTTIFKIIAGAENYDKGELMIAKGRRIGVLDQIPEYPEGYTVLMVLNSAFEELHQLKMRMDSMQSQFGENTDEAAIKRYGELLEEYEARGGYETDTALKRVCTGLDIGDEMLQRPFAALSGGEKTRVNLARIILTNTDILLLDEPTNHLDIRAVEWLEEFLEEYRGTVLVISHDRYFLDRVVERVIEVEDGVAETYDGNYSKFAMLKEQNRIERLKRYEQEQKKIRQLEAAVKRMHEWAQRADNPKMHRRAFSMEKRLERITRDAEKKPKIDRKLSKGFRAQDFAGSDIVLMRGVKKSFDSNRLLDGVDLLIKRDDRLALLGNNGAGKTTLLRIIRGELEPDAGFVRVGASVKAAYLPQHIHFEHPEMSVMETIRHEFIIDEGSARNMLAGFMFRGEDVFKAVGSLSGGELSRLKLCILMQRGVNFLILDEPTNHLDIQSREWVEEALDAFEGTILFVSHDRYFIRKFATSVCELENGVLSYFDGDYESFREYKRRVEEEERKNAAARKQTEKQAQEVKARRTDPAALMKKLAKLEGEIAEAERELSEIEQAMESNASDYEALNSLMAEKDSIAAKLDMLYKEWLEVHQLVEG